MPCLTRSGGMPCLVLVFALISLGLPAFAEDSVPGAFTKDRYESLRVRSPFVVATAVAGPVSQASFAANWYVGGVARLGDDYFVTIQSRDLSKQFSLVSGQEVDGVMLASVNWSDFVGKSTVILRKGTETAKLEFNETQLHGPATTASTAAASPAPGHAVAATAPVGGQVPVGATVAAMNARNAGMPVNAPGLANGVVPPRRRALPIPAPPR